MSDITDSRDGAAAPKPAKEKKGFSSGPGWGGPPKGAGTGGPARNGGFPKGHHGIPRNPEKEGSYSQRKAERNERMKEILVQIAEDPNCNPNARVSAVTAYLNREEGMPVQQQVVAAKIETNAPTDPAAVADRLTALLNRARATQAEDAEDDGAVH